MAKNVNEIKIKGRLGKDPETRITPTGSTVSTFSIAVNRPTKGQDGNWNDNTEWFDVVAWEKESETVQNFLKKGSDVMIFGRLNQQEWTDKTSGEKRRKTVIVGESIFPLADTRKAPAQQEGEYYEEEAAPAPVYNRQVSKSPTPAQSRRPVEAAAPARRGAANSSYRDDDEPPFGGNGSGSLPPF